MRTRALFLVSTGLLAALTLAGCASDASNAGAPSGGDELIQHSQVSEWLTRRGDIQHPFQPQGSTSFATPPPPSGSVGTLIIDDGVLKQKVEGFGAAYTDASAHILRYELSREERRKVLDDLMGPNGLGLSLLRLPVAASDSTAKGAYSYDDGPADPDLHNFNLKKHDYEYILPQLRMIVHEINPDARIIATPWSPPAWMKDGSTGPDGMNGGTLRNDERIHQAYAEYLVKFVQGYWHYGVPIYALTPENEPLAGLNRNFPSMHVEADEEAHLIARHIRHSLNNANFKWVKLLGYDHNWGNSYPKDLLTHLKEQRSGDAVGDLGGMAFHCYGGDNSGAMSDLHGKNPNLDIFVTECDRSETNARERTGHLEGVQFLIRAMNNWSRSYLAWQIVLHPDGSPNQGTGCKNDDASNNPTGEHCVGVLSIQNHQVTKEHDYAYLGHASKFVARDARIATLRVGAVEKFQVGSVEAAAFVNPDGKGPHGKYVLVAYNASKTDAVSFQVKWHDATFNASLDPEATATYTW